MNNIFPLVTVKILTYNNFDNLEQTIKSVFCQDYPNIELIISDDGSLNYDLDFIEKLLFGKTSNIKDIKLIRHKTNVGTVKNLNNCIKSSKGDYFIGIASDDMFYGNDIISKVVKFFKDTNALIVTSKRSVYDEKMQGEIEILPKGSDMKYFSNDNEFLYERLCISNFISGSCTSYARILFEKHGLFDERYNLLEDYPLYLKLAREGEKIFYFDEITIKYRLGGVSTSGKINPKLKLDSLRTIENEILPFKDKLNSSLYNWKALEYDFIVNNRKLSFKLCKKYPKEIFLKILNKIKIINIKPENLIYAKEDKYD